MSKYSINDTTLTAIANAIRAKEGSSNQIAVSDFATRIAGISGGGTETMTESEWNALSTQQKRQKGIVAISKKNAGYMRGVLVNGANYRPSDTYLPNTDDAKINCFAFYDNFDKYSTQWGDGTTPIICSKIPSQYQNEEAVYFDSLSSSSKFKIDLPSITSNFTLYCVMKGISYVSGDIIVLGSVSSWSASNLIMLYHRSGTMLRSSIHSNDDDFLDIGNNYVAIAIRSSSMKASWFAHTGAKRLNVPYNAHATEFTFGSYGSGNYSSNLAMKFVAMINEAESDATITANLTSLASVYNLS